LQVRYDAKADILLLVVRQDAPVDAVEEPGGLIISYGEDGEPVSVEFLNAAKRHLVGDGELSVTLQSR
jgi:uncharacterized protein YuzE